MEAQQTDRPARPRSDAQLLISSPAVFTAPHGRASVTNLGAHYTAFAFCGRSEEVECGRKAR
jgi:hypothetical protein